MSAYAYDPDHYLVSTLRSIESWTRDRLEAMPEMGGVFDLEMSYPDTTRLAKDVPLRKLLVHFELDDDPDIVLGFGQPGIDLFDEDAEEAMIQEATLHRLNFDIGIWASAEAGGATKRMEARQALMRLFGSVYGRQEFNLATEGLQVVSFEGGSDVLDRVGDLPMWRTTRAELVVEVFGRIIPALAELTAMETNQLQNLTIIGDDGEPEPVKTNEP